jgi:hypothetical protein
MRLNSPMGQELDENQAGGEESERKQKTMPDVVVGATKDDSPGCCCTSHRGRRMNKTYRMETFSC